MIPQTEFFAISATLWRVDRRSQGESILKQRARVDGSLLGNLLFRRDRVEILG
jgi:hypothetical protein